MEQRPRERQQASWSLMRGLVGMASVVVLLAGLRAARGILVPVLVAVFLSVACAPILAWLRRWRVPTPLAVAVIVLGILGVGLALTAFLGTSLTEFVRTLPAYQAALGARVAEMIAGMEARGIRLPEDFDDQIFDPGAAFGAAALLFNSVRTLLTNGLLILLTVVFILLEAAGFEEKLRRALRDPEATFVRFASFTQGVKQYLAIKTAVSALTGTLVALWVAMIGVDYPLLWGLLAFLLNFIPTIGSILASVPAVLLALVQFGPGPAGMVLAGYLMINVTIGNLLEPRWAGRGVGLSPLVVFLSLLLWGWVLGPVGLLLAAPLTMTLKLALEGSPQTHWLAVLLGPERATAPPLPSAPPPPPLRQRAPEEV
jgi:AI-2 transport protein TqsA